MMASGISQPCFQGEPLKPCPSCGEFKAALYATRPPGYKVRCNRCYFSTGRFATMEAAAASWNTRNEPKAQRVCVRCGEPAPIMGTDTEVGALCYSCMTVGNLVAWIAELKTARRPGTAEYLLNALVEAVEKLVPYPLFHDAMAAESHDYEKSGRAHKMPYPLLVALRKASQYLEDGKVDEEPSEAHALLCELYKVMWLSIDTTLCYAPILKAKLVKYFDACSQSNTS